MILFCQRTILVQWKYLGPQKRSHSLVLEPCGSKVFEVMSSTVQQQGLNYTVGPLAMIAMVTNLTITRFSALGISDQIRHSSAEYSFGASCWTLSNEECHNE